MSNDVARRILDNLADAAQTASRASEYKVQLVAEAREAGATWEDIGRALGVKKQTAHRVYARQVNPND